MKRYAQEFGNAQLKELGDAKFFEFKKKQKIKKINESLNYIESLDEQDLNLYFEVGKLTETISETLYRSISYVDIPNLKGAFESLKQVHKYFSKKSNEDKTVEEYLSAIYSLKKTLENKEKLQEFYKSFETKTTEEKAYTFIRLYNQPDLKGRVMQGVTSIALSS